MAPFVGKDYTKDRVMPILLELLKDESSEVRLNAAQKMIKLAPIVGDTLLTTNLLATLKQMTADPQWRVRMAVCELVGKLSVQLGADVYRPDGEKGKDLESIFIMFFTNPAAEVRETAANMAKDIGEAFGQEWVIGEFIPKIMDNIKDE